jgi:hypothetical protein
MGGFGGKKKKTALILAQLERFLRQDPPYSITG